MLAHAAGRDGKLMVPPFTGTGPAVTPKQRAGAGRRSLPSRDYRVMARHERRPPPHAGARGAQLGAWGPDDEIGTLNDITPEAIAAAARLATTGKVFALGIPLQREGPQRRRGCTPGRSPTVAGDNDAAEVRPSEIAGFRNPSHILAIPNMGLTLGEIFFLESWPRLRRRRALRVPAGGASAARHPRRRDPDQPVRHRGAGVGVRRRPPPRPIFRLKGTPAPES